MEKESLSFPKKETDLLVKAFLEHLGYSQKITLHWIKSSFNALKESGNWGE